MNKKLIGRLVLLLAIMLTLLLLAKFTSLGEYFSVQRLQDLVLNAGPYGLLIFFAFFLLGTLMSVPGAVFLVFAMLTYGYINGILLSFITAQLCAMINFLFARFVGGKALSEIKNQRIKNMLHKVDSHPISTLFWLRFFLLLSPVVNYALALTNISSRKFFIANAISMVFPFMVIIGGTIFVRSTYFQEVILAWFKTWLAA